jgi:hypothetical protein
VGIIQSLLNKAFPLMALAGLLLAGYGLITTPDEMKATPQFPRLTAKYIPDAELLSPDLGDNY